MVALGYATADRHYSSDYVSAEDSAKVTKRGFWAGTFQIPSDYRHSVDAPRAVRNSATKRNAAKAVASDWQGRANGNCNIKGNRNRKGQWIYHMPGMPITIRRDRKRFSVPRLRRRPRAIDGQLFDDAPLGAP